MPLLSARKYVVGWRDSVKRQNEPATDQLDSELLLLLGQKACQCLASQGISTVEALLGSNTNEMARKLTRQHNYIDNTALFEVFAWKGRASQQAETRKEQLVGFPAFAKGIRTEPEKKRGPRTASLLESQRPAKRIRMDTASATRSRPASGQQTIERIIIRVRDYDGRPSQAYLSQIAATYPWNRRPQQACSGQAYLSPPVPDFLWNGQPPQTHGGQAYLAALVADYSWNGRPPPQAQVGQAYLAPIVADAYSWNGRPTPQAQGSQAYHAPIVADAYPRNGRSPPQAQGGQAYHPPIVADAYPWNGRSPPQAQGGQAHHALIVADTYPWNGRPLPQSQGDQAYRSPAAAAYYRGC